MCDASSKEAAAVAIVCMFINAFNVAYVLMPEIEVQLRRQSWFAYVPDVHDLSSLVGSQTSNYTMLGLAVISIIFDAFIFFGSMQGIPELLDSGCVWHYCDLGADFVVGMASANYTRPRVIRKRTEYVPSNLHVSDDVSLTSRAPTLANANITDNDETSPGYTAADSSRQVFTAANNQHDRGLLRKDTIYDESARPLSKTQTAEDEEKTREETLVSAFLKPPTVRQFLHFGYVIMRAVVKELPDMCLVSSREAIAIVVACLFINAFNVTYVLKPEIRRQLSRQAWFAYVPDVHDVSKFVGADTSKYIALGLAGISIIFDAFILVGTVQVIPELLDSGCVWHYVDLGADFIVGLASANYTRPRIIQHKTEVIQKSLHRSGCEGATPCDPTMAPTTAAPNATDDAPDDGAGPRGANDTSSRRRTPAAPTAQGDGQGPLGNERSVHLDSAMRPLQARGTENAYQKREETTTSVLLEPPTVRQFLHFSYVIMRAAVKFQKLGMLGSMSRMMKT
ncbi:uncharacterized protein LOC142585670 [Dermacentor variabilis]|uniref:uncharacterized protein LOC142585670 n=1 Tax=Dermacentor variabilis TaxID=34621 RepID=UPI003F5B5FCB